MCFWLCISTGTKLNKRLSVRVLSRETDTLHDTQSLFYPDDYRKLVEFRGNSMWRIHSMTRTRSCFFFRETLWRNVVHKIRRLVAMKISSIWIFTLPIIAICSASAFPVNATTALDLLDHNAREVLRRATPAAPHFVVYADSYDPSTTGPPAASAIKGFNVFALSFLLIEGAWDKAYEWTTFTDAQRTTIKSQYASAGIKLVVSVFGSTDVPTSTNADPIATANTMAAWVKQYQLDGIDVDYEDFNAFAAGDGKAEAWLISFTKQLRTQLPQGTYLLTHAPVAPWFSPTQWGGGGYLKVHSSVGSLIDWYNIQFYNQGASEYTTCANLLTTSSNTWPKTAVFQIAANGVPLEKIVIGKPATSSDASNGFMSTSTLASCLQQAKNNGWTGGAMVWQYPKATSSWITAVRSLSWPV
uniref:chitinase n=1 Tax=Psilocybe cubensis TaxID=181762 RepID=A0A8H7XUS7_PSICU